MIQINEGRGPARDTACIAMTGVAILNSKREWVDFDGKSFSVDAALIADGFGIGPASVQALMRARRITSRCERGIEQDAGRYRLTFRHHDRALRFVVDDRGEILQRTVEPVQPA